MVHKKEQMRFPNPPSEIIFEILGWLPVKSVCRFRCVSKTWLSLISEPHSVNSHCNKAFENEHVFQQRRRVLIRDAGLGQYYSLNLDERLNHTNIKKVNDAVVVVPNYLKFHTFPKFVFFCNGLLFLKSFLVFYLINPATKETKSVELFPSSLYKWDKELCGFGFDLSKLDYKVVRGEFSEFDLGFSVYSLKTGSWRGIRKRYPYKSLHDLQGKLLNGSIHWLVCRKYNNVTSMVLLSFDLEDDEVQEMPLPPEFLIDFDTDGDEKYFLSVFQECLCVGKTDACEFWVMKEYGVTSSWSKISMPCNEGLHSGFVWKNHHLLLDWRQQRLVMYNFEDGSSQNLSVGKKYKVDFTSCYSDNLIYNFEDGSSRNLSAGKKSKVDFAGCYLESLVSPKNYHYD